MVRQSLKSPFVILVVCSAVLAGSQMHESATACPFCRPVKTTFTEDINAADVAALAELVHRPERPDPAEGEIPAADIIDSYKTTFRITEIYKGEEHAKVGQEVVAIYTGEAKPGAICLLRGVQPEDMQWAPPIALSEQAQLYVEKVLTLPKDGPERLSFFESYLEHEDTVLRNDAFDEFARADYATLKGIKDKIDHDRLMGWIEDPDVTPTNRRLYLTMLGVCGRDGDEEKLKQMLASGDKNQMKGLDSLIACYLTLAGPDGLPLIEDEFLKGGVFWDPEYVHTYAAIMALRFHGQESDAIPKNRLLASLRIMLDRPQLADLVIPDLARWEDWAAMDRLVRMFKDSDKKSSWVRVPIINYLRACPLQEAKDHLTELAKIDPDAMRRASTFFPFAPGGRKKDDTDVDSEKDKEDGDKTPEAAAAVESSDKVQSPKSEPQDDQPQSSATEASPSTDTTAETGGGSEVTLIGNTPIVDAADDEASGDEAPGDGSSVDEPSAAGSADPASENSGGSSATRTEPSAAATVAATPTEAGDGQPKSLQGYLLAATLPLAAAVLLFGFMWVVLRRPDSATDAPGAHHVS